MTICAKTHYSPNKHITYKYWRPTVHISEVLLTVLRGMYEREKASVSFARVQETKEKRRGEDGVES